LAVLIYYRRTQSAGRKSDSSSFEITHLSMSAGPNAFLLLVLIAQIELVRFWFLFHGTAASAPREPLVAGLGSYAKRM